VKSDLQKKLQTGNFVMKTFIVYKSYSGVLLEMYIKYEALLISKCFLFLIPWYSLFLQQSVVLQLFPIMEFKDSSPSVQEPITTNSITSHPFNIFPWDKLYCHPIYLCHDLFIRFSNQNCVCILCFLICATCILNP
jgi:hypothetical protein